MKFFSLFRAHRVWAVVVTLTLTALLYFAWAVVAEGAVPLQNDAPPLSAPVEVTVVRPSPADPPGQVPPPVMAQVASASGPVSSAPASPSEPCSPAAACPPPGSPAACNTVVQFDTSLPQHADIWTDYNCVKYSVFPAGTLDQNEVGYTIELTEELDLSLAVTLVESVTHQTVVTHMNVFAAILTDCDNNACIAGSENKNLDIYRHAVYTNASPAVYNAVLDSDNIDGFGDMIIACGNPNPGWCSSVIRADITCNDYTISDTTAGGPDDITYYIPRYWVNKYAYDGPERVYSIVLTETAFFTFTLHYSGSETLPYNSYMSYFLLDDTCNQRDVWDNPASPEHLFIGERTYTSTQGVYAIPAGTYYLVVDGMHLPQGDAFQLDVQCVKPETVFLPLVLRNYPPIPTVTVNPTSGPSETTFWFTGVNFDPNETVSHWIIAPGGKVDISPPTIQANSQGQFLLSIPFGVGWPTGTYTYHALGAQSQQEATVNFQITASVQGGAAEGDILSLEAFVQ